MADELQNQHPHPYQRVHASDNRRQTPGRRLGFFFTGRCDGAFPDISRPEEDDAENQTDGPKRQKDDIRPKQGFHLQGEQHDEKKREDKKNLIQGHTQSEL